MTTWSDSQIIDGLEGVWTSIIDATANLDETQWRTPTDCPGWSVADQLVHLIGIERGLQGHPAPEVDVEETAHLRNPIGEMNERWIVARRGRTGDEVRAEFAEVTAERIAELRGLSPEALGTVGWSPIGQVPLRTFMVIRVMDSWIHEQDVRLALGRPGGRDGFGEEVALTRADAALGVVVGKGAGAPDGASVAFDVRGPLGGVRRIAVADGRASAVDGDDATATIQLSQETYVRRFAGRMSFDAALAAPGTELSGDRSLAEAVLGALAVMI